MYAHISSSFTCTHFAYWSWLITWLAYRFVCSTMSSTSDGVKKSLNTSRMQADKATAGPTGRVKGCTLYNYWCRAGTPWWCTTTALTTQSLSVSTCTSPGCTSSSSTTTSTSSTTTTSSTLTSGSLSCWRCFRWALTACATTQFVYYHYVHVCYCVFLTSGFACRYHRNLIHLWVVVVTITAAMYVYYIGVCYFIVYSLYLHTHMHIHMLSHAHAMHTPPTIWFICESGSSDYYCCYVCLLHWCLLLYYSFIYTLTCTCTCTCTYTCSHTHTHTPCQGRI